MSEPIFLTFAEVQTLHVLSLERYGGLHGIRDQGGAESAVERVMIEIAERRCSKEAVAEIFRAPFPPGAGLTG